MYKHGVIPSPPDDRHWPVSALLVVSSQHEPAYTLPDFDKIPVYNQSEVESCMAHAVCTEREYTEMRQTGVFKAFSKVYVYGNRPQGDYAGPGLIPFTSLQRLQDRGICSYELLPGNYEVPKAIELFNENIAKTYPDALPKRITSYALSRSKEEVKSAIRQGYPVLGVVPIQNEFYQLNKTNHVMPAAQSQILGYHAVVLYGWNETGWLMRNSWGTEWGNEGNCILSYDFPLTEAWLVTDNLLPVVKSVPYNRTIKKIVIHHLGDGMGIQEDLTTRWNPFRYQHPNYDWGINGDGQIYKGRPLIYEGAHAIATYQKYITGDYAGYNWWNRNSIGIVLGADLTVTSLPEVMLNSLIECVMARMKEYNLSVSDVLPHREIMATACPGTSWSWDNFIKELQYRMEVSSTMQVAVAYWTPKDYSAAEQIASKLGNCGMFCRNANPALHPDAQGAKRLIVVGGPEVTGHSNVTNLCGATGSDTLILAGNFAKTL